MSFTSFVQVNLRNAKNLDSVRFSEKCSVDFHTMKEWQNIPSKFLLNMGLSEHLVNYLPILYDSKPLRLYPVFLSHSWKDKKFASKLYDALTARKVLVWYDERKLKLGDDIREGINNGIKLHDKFVLVCSENSLKNSWWVDKEINRALDKEEKFFRNNGRQINTIIPITIDNYVFENWDSPKKSDISRYVIGDFREWENDNIFKLKVDKLIDALNADRGKETPPTYL